MSVVSYSPRSGGPLSEHIYGYVTGHDGLLHASKQDGTTMCSMGRSQSPRYSYEGPVTCLHCLLRPWRFF